MEPLMRVKNKSLFILNQICSQKLQIYESIHNLLLQTELI